MFVIVMLKTCIMSGSTVSTTIPCSKRECIESKGRRHTNRLALHFNMSYNILLNIVVFQANSSLKKDNLFGCLFKMLNGR